MLWWTYQYTVLNVFVHLKVMLMMQLSKKYIFYNIEYDLDIFSEIVLDLANENVPDNNSYQKKEVDDYLKMYRYEELVRKI